MGMRELTRAARAAGFAMASESDVKAEPAVQSPPDALEAAPSSGPAPGRAITAYVPARPAFFRDLWGIFGGKPLTS